VRKGASKRPGLPHPAGTGRGIRAQRPEDLRGGSAGDCRRAGRRQDLAERPVPADGGEKAGAGANAAVKIRIPFRPGNGWAA
jgi:hypothetical protein